MQLFRTWTLRWWEVGLVKLCLLSLGIILTIYFYDYLAGLLWLWWTLFVITLLALLPKTSEAFKRQTNLSGYNPSLFQRGCLSFFWDFFVPATFSRPLADEMIFWQSEYGEYGGNKFKRNYCSVRIVLAVMLYLKQKTYVNIRNISNHI